MQCGLLKVAVQISLEGLGQFGRLNDHMPVAIAVLGDVLIARLRIADWVDGRLIGVIEVSAGKPDGVGIADHHFYMIRGREHPRIGFGLERTSAQDDVNFVVKVFCRSIMV